MSQEKRKKFIAEGEEGKKQDSFSRWTLRNPADTTKANMKVIKSYIFKTRSLYGPLY